MCRSIRPLFNFDPPATEAEVRAAALQFVRKISGFQAPSKANEEAFQRAVEQVARSASQLLSEMEARSAPKDRATEAAKAKQRSARRFAS
jgi:hypothetical protein